MLHPSTQMFNMCEMLEAMYMTFVKLMSMGMSLYIWYVEPNVCVVWCCFMTLHDKPRHVRT